MAFFVFFIILLRLYFIQIKATDCFYFNGEVCKENILDEAKKFMHEDFTFRFMGKIPVYAQGSSVIKKSYDKETYFTEFLEVVGALLPQGITLTPIDVIADEDSAAVIMVGDAEGAYGEYDNEYVFTFKFKDGKIIELDEYTSDVLVVEALYGNTLWPNSNPPLLEYFWHSKGPNYSEENFQMLVEKWNERVDQTSCSINNASVLTPKAETENFDFIFSNPIYLFLYSFFKKSFYFLFRNIIENFI